MRLNDEPPNKIIIIPDGELWRVSYPLLTDENGTLLLHKYAISLALSISSLKGNIKSTEYKEEINIALVVGEPEVSGKDKICVELPMATKESQGVKNLFETKICGHFVIYCCTLSVYTV